MNQSSGKVCTELHDIAFDYKEIEWNIRNASSLPVCVGYMVQSPIFDFADATWELQMYPYGDGPESEGFIDIAIKRTNSHIRQHYVFYKIYLLTRRGKEYNCCSYKSWFDWKCQWWIVTKFIKRSELLKMKNNLLSNGILTIICQMRTHQTAGFRELSTTESTSFKLDSATQCNLSVPLDDNKILHDFKELFLKQEDCDVIIKVKGTEFPAHKFILKARSPVLASMFRNDMMEKSTCAIDIEDCDPYTFSNFLNFLYCADIGKLSTENVFSLFTTADKYNVPDLRKKCLEIMKENLCLDNFCDTISLALLHLDAELIQLSIDFFAKNYQDILLTVKWQQFLAENPTQGNELLIKVLVPRKSSN